MMLLQIADNDPSYRVALRVTGTLPAFVAGATVRGVSGCFQFALESGDVVIAALIGGGSAPPTPTSSTPQVHQLPSTSTTK
jgi:hypothetical protein